MSDVLVEARSATRMYGDKTHAFTAVHAATCRVVVGDRIALVGPSGSGKSTLLYLLAGLELLSEGAVVWPSLAAGTRPIPSAAGFIFQAPNLLPLTAVENVELPLLISDTRAEIARATAMAMLAEFGLSDIADRFADDLSGGQAERIGAARALVSRPSLIFADEPTGQVDSATAQLVIGQLLSAADRSDAAVIVATHDECVARRLATRWTMSHGRLLTAL